MGRGEPTDSKLDCPLDFEGIIGETGLSKRDHLQGMLVDNMEGDNSAKKGIDFDQCDGESFVSVEKVPQTPLFDFNSNRRWGDYGAVIPFEEDLMEARISWDVGKILGLKVSNEKTMVTSLSKVHECQDFVFPKKKGAS